MIYSTAPYAALILRLSLGIMFLAHGGLKIWVFGLPGTIDFFGSVGIPMPELAVYATIAFELIGGVFLILGLLTRLVCLLAVPLLAGTIFYVHGSVGWLFSNPDGGWEYSAFLMAAAAAQLLLGDGVYALRLKR